MIKRTETLILDVKENAAYITLNRPQDANAVNLALAKELMAAAIHCDEDPNIRVVVLTGAGSSFCAGGDLRDFAEKGDQLPAALKELTIYLHSAVSSLARMNKPLITAVNGVAAGAGMSLAIAGDLIIAAESALFVTAYTAAGLSPDGGMTHVLPRAIGLMRAKEMILMNKRLKAREALSWGLVNRCVPDTDLINEVKLCVKSLTNGPTKSFGKIKELFVSCFEKSLETQMETEARGICDMAKTRDGNEGINAFVQKRKPKFQGS